MIWLDSISQLQFYNQPKGVPCYCMTLLQPFDMILQGSFTPSAYSFNITFYVYSADGLTEYEEITANFSYYIAQNPFTQQYFFNARLNQWSDSMCLYKCFIIRAVIVNSGGNTVFDKYTERYCQSDCCDTAQDVEFEQVGVDIAPTSSTPVTTSELLTACGDKLIKITSADNCYNKFTDEYYNIPTVVIQGDATFSFLKTNIFKGRIVVRPREIQRNISYNCKLQKVESTPLYLFEGFEYFPPYVMREIEGQLHSEYIWIQDANGSKRYHYEGGTPFKKVDGANNCTEVFKLETDMQECRQRQVFGCADPCDNIGYQNYQQFFLIPANYAGNGFYDDNRNYVAADLTGLIDFLRSYSDITDVAQVSFSPVADCEFYALIGMTGNGYFPNTIYYDNSGNQNRIFAINFDEASEVCNFVIPTQCAIPVIGDATLVIGCEAPVIGDTVMEVITPEEVDIIQYIPLDWQFVMSGSPAAPEGVSATVYNNEVTFSIKVRNYGIPEPEPTEVFSGQVIGVMGATGRPQVLRAMTSANNPLADEAYVTVDEWGLITYSGPPTDVVEGDYSEIELIDLKFNI